MTMTRENGPDDPRGVIAAAYAMERVSAAECRTIFLDWLLGIERPEEAARRLLGRYAILWPDHPMTVLLAAAARGEPRPPRRRGGAAGRRKPAGRG